MRQTNLTEKFDGQDYQFGYLDTSAAIELGTEVGQKLLPTMGALVASQNKEATGEVLAPLFNSLAQQLDPKSTQRIVRQLCSVVQAVGGQGAGNLGDDAVFEQHFRGRPGVALKVAAKSFEVNCGDFFAAAVALGSNLKAKASTQDR